MQAIEYNKVVTTSLSPEWDVLWQELFDRVMNPQYSQENED